MSAAAGLEFQRVQHQAVVAGLVQGEARVLVGNHPAQARCNGGEQLPERQLRHHGVADFEQRAETIAVVRELPLELERGGGVERVVNRHRHLGGHLPHELQFFRGDGMLADISEAQRAELPVGRGQRQKTTGADAALTKNIEHARPAALAANVRHHQRLLMGGDPAGRRLAHGQLNAGRFGRAGRFEHVQAHAAGGLVVEHHRDKIERQDTPEMRREAAEQRTDIPVFQDAVGHFQQRLPCPRVHTERYQHIGAPAAP